MNIGDIMISQGGLLEQRAIERKKR